MVAIRYLPEISQSIQSDGRVWRGEGKINTEEKFLFFEKFFGGVVEKRKRIRLCWIMTR